MTDQIEVPLDNWVASFDGRVLEIFTPYQQGSMRYRVSLLVDLSIDGNTLTAEFARRDRGFWPFRDEQRAGVEQLVAAVNAARGVG